MQQGELVRALETAEKDKNWLMTWLLRWQDPEEIPTTSYDAMRQLLRPDTAVVYWHYSPDALTTFILRWDKAQPTVIDRATNDSQAGIRQVSKLEAWLKTWNQTYTRYIGKDKTNPNRDETWRENLPSMLEKLADLLDIAQIKTYLSHSSQLILVPHRDLHRLPLPALFSEYKTTTLPSLQLGQILRPSPFSLSVGEAIGSCLTITAPNHQGLAPLYHAEAETDLINQLLAKTHTVATIAAHAATQSTVSQALEQPHHILHFNGHAAYNFAAPIDSALALAGTDKLTVQDLVQLPLDTYSLITLASCETALSGHQTITTEYVGITSAFLAQDIPHILSTLWTVESAASMVFIVEFYSQLHQNPVAAYHHSCQTLRDLTVAQLKTRYVHWLTLDLSANVREFLEEERRDLDTMDAEHRPYHSPYFWAAFTLTGLGA